MPNLKCKYAIINKRPLANPVAIGSDKIPNVLGIVGDPDHSSDSRATFDVLARPLDNKIIQSLIVICSYYYANGEHKEWDNWF